MQCVSIESWLRKMQVQITSQPQRSLDNLKVFQPNLSCKVIVNVNSGMGNDILCPEWDKKCNKYLNVHSHLALLVVLGLNLLFIPCLHRGSFPPLSDAPPKKICPWGSGDRQEQRRVARGVCRV